MLRQAPHTGLQLLFCQGVEDQVDPYGGKQVVLVILTSVQRAGLTSACPLKAVAQVGTYLCHLCVVTRAAQMTCLVS